MQHTLPGRTFYKDKLLPEIVDHLAQETPDKIYAEYPNSPTSYDSGYRVVTYRDFANAVNGAAHWLSTTLGPGQNNEPLAYIGPNDIRYTTFILAAVKAGYSVFLTSPRNSVAAHDKLFKKLHCNKLLSPSRDFPNVAPILTSCTYVQQFDVPSVEKLLDEPHPIYKCQKTFQDARFETLFIIHTSGSTGFPKPLIYQHETGRRHINMLAQDPPSGFRSLNQSMQEGRVFNCFPPFHGACLVTYLFYGIPFGMVNIAPLSGTIVDAHGVASALQHTSADSALFVPSIVLELGLDAQLLDQVSERLRIALYAGGDLPQEVGDKVAAKLDLFCQYGLSEMGLLPQLLPSTAKSSDWKYVYIHPCVSVMFDEVSDGNYELIVKRDATSEDYHVSFTLFPQQDEFRSRDLFQKHSKIPDFWTWRARTDDVIVFINGEKTNPISMEQHIVSQNPKVSAAIVVGNRRFQAALLLQSSSAMIIRSTEQEAELIELVWPSIHQANKVAPAHARVDKSMILVMRSDRPAVRTPKNTIQRAATIQLYSEDIEKLYGRVDTWTKGVKSFYDIETITNSVRRAFVRVRDLSSISDTDNFFTNGIDSLQALTMIRDLRQDLQTPDLAVSTLYRNPSVAALSETIFSSQKHRETSREQEKTSQVERVESILKQYKQKIHDIPSSCMEKKTSSKRTVLLTGTTGSLGAWLLGSLLSDSNVLHVYCLNRRHVDVSVQKASNASAGLTYEVEPSRITFLKFDYEQPLLGLDETTYERIRQNLTTVIHNAWSVNFNMSIESFNIQLNGLLSLFSLSTSTNFACTFFYISSISSVMELSNASNTIPEELISDPTAIGSSGYAQSKFVAENLCSEASRLLHIPMSVARVGQIAGPVHQRGIWNPTEWIPRLIMSSINLGAIPDSLGAMFDTVNWFPIDTLAQIITKIALDDQLSTPDNNANFQILHLLNPKTTAWHGLLPGILETVSRLAGKQIKGVSSEQWTTMIKQDLETAMSARTDDDEETRLQSHLEKNPAAKILDFYATTVNNTRKQTPFELTRTLEKSSLLRDMEPIQSASLNAWIEGWLSPDCIE